MFKKRENVADIEEGNLLSPKFDKDGLIPVTTTDFDTKEVWHKGETSGFVQKVIEIRIDDDQDSIWMSVDIGDGASCHVGYKSCFYRYIPLGKIKDTEKLKMEFKDNKKKFDPKTVYKGKPNPTKL